MVEQLSTESIQELQARLEALLREEHPERAVLRLPTELRLPLQQQLALRSRLQDKLPSWQLVLAYIPSTLALEQCSSQLAAHYKRRFVRPEDSLLDMTGGLGVDFSAMAEAAARAVYIEQQPTLVAAARYNLPRLLPTAQLSILEGRSTDCLPSLIATHRPTLIYLDPARREQQDKQRRVYALEDCEPDFLSLLPELRGLYTSLGLPTPRLVVKVSPMLDLKHTLRSLPEVHRLHILAVQSEVKELILELDLSQPPLTSYQEAEVVVSILSPQGEHFLSFPRAFALEEELSPNYAERLEQWLYLPHAALMKSGLFATLAERYQLRALHPSTHIYTSAVQLSDFPGRCFALEEVLPFSSSILKQLARQRPALQIISRNFPLSAQELRTRLKAHESSEQSLIATTLSTGDSVLLRCRPMRHSPS